MFSQPRGESGTPLGESAIARTVEVEPPGAQPLIAYWTLNEASGTRADSEGGFDLEDINTVGSDAGIVGDAADFIIRVAIEDQERLRYTIAADSEAIALGDEDFTVCLWYRPDVATGGRWLAGQTGISYRWYILAGSNGILTFTNRNAGGGLDAAFLAQPTNATWHFLAGRYNATTKLSEMIVFDEGRSASATVTGGRGGSVTGVFALGGNPLAALPYDWLMQHVSLYSAVLTNAHLSWLYNNGNGRTKSEIDALI